MYSECMTNLPFSPFILSSRLIYKLTSTYIGFGCWSFPNFLLSSSKESFVSWITFLIFLIWKKNYKRNKNYTLNRSHLLFIKVNVIFFKGFSSFLKVFICSNMSISYLHIKKNNFTTFMENAIYFKQKFSPLEIHTLDKNCLYCVSVHNTSGSWTILDFNHLLQ